MRARKVKLKFLELFFNFYILVFLSIVSVEFLSMIHLLFSLCACSLNRKSDLLIFQQRFYFKTAFKINRAKIKIELTVIEYAK
jgi:hypothetical protein